MKKIRDILPYIVYVILCSGVGSNHIYIYIILTFFLLLYSVKVNRRLLFPKNKFFLILVLFEVAFSIGSFWNKDFYITPAILPLLLYVSQYYITTISKKVSSQKMFASMAVGFSIHCLLNLIINIGVVDRNLTDIWTGQISAATGQSLYLIFPLSFVIYAFVFSKVKKYKILSIPIALISCAFSLSIGTRSTIIIFGLVLVIFLIYSFIKDNGAGRRKIVIKALGLVAVAALVIGMNLFGIRDAIESSNFYGRFTAFDTSWSDNGRLQALISSPEVLVQYPFGAESGTVKIGGLDYIHNMWLDCWLQAGVIPTILLAVYFILVFVAIIKKRKAIGVEEKSLYMIVCIFCTLNFAVEPVLKSNPTILALWFMFSYQIVASLAVSDNTMLGKKHVPTKTTENGNKILWTTNIIMPYPSKQIGMKATAFGGWLSGLMGQVLQTGKYKLAVAAVYKKKQISQFNSEKASYYLLPCKDDTIYSEDLEGYWRKVVYDFRPDLIHLHGAEFMHNLALEKACPDERYLVSLQGVTGPIAKKYLAGISKKEYRRNRTLRDFIRGSVLKDQKRFYRRAKYEEEILKKCDAIVGRTKWDQEEASKIAKGKPYYKCNEILRDSFYNQNWNIKEIEPYSIYISQASYPIKGFHSLLDALPEIIERYPKTKVYVGGTNITDRSTFKKKMLYSGYAKILDNKISTNNLEGHINFLGEISEKEVLSYMKKCNVFVQCSVIENSSNSLGEAMMIGMPCVASNVGGTPDLLDAGKEEGLLYEFGDKKALVECISTVFDDPKFATKMGKNAQKHAKITHDRQRNVKTMLDIYKKVIESKCR